MEGDGIDNDDLIALSDDEIERLDELSDSVEPPVDSDDGMSDTDETAPPIEPIRDDAILFFRQHKKSVYTCAVNSEGTLAASGSGDDTACVWDVHDGKLVFSCDGHKDSVTHVAFNHNDSLLATADMSGIIRVWNIAEKQVSWSTEVGDLGWLCWHHSTDVLISGTDDGLIWIWLVPHGHTKTIPGSGSATSCGIIMGDGKHVSAGYADGTVRIWDIKAAQTVLTLIEHDDNVVCVAAAKNGQLVASGSGSGLVISLTTNGKTVAKLTDFEDTVECIAFSPDDHLLAAGVLDGSLLIWDVVSSVARHKLSHQGGGFSKVFWVGEHFVIAVGLDGVVREYDVRSGELVRDWHGHRNQVLDAATSKNNAVLVTASEDTTCGVFGDVIVDA